jgi:Tol biopolymer transport system component
MKVLNEILTLSVVTAILSACSFTVPNAKIDANVDQSQNGTNNSSGGANGGTTNNGQPQNIIVNVNNNPNINTNVNPNISNSSSNSSTTNNQNNNTGSSTGSSSSSGNNVSSGSLSDRTTPTNYKILYILRDSNSMNTIYTANIDGSLKRKLIQGESNQNNSFPASSPDGSKVAYNSLYNLYVMNKDGTSNISIFKGQLYGPSGTPSWTSDGKQIYYQDSQSIYVINADGTQKSKVYQPSEGISFSRISPDGKTLAYISYASGKPILTIVGTNAVGETQITDNSKIILDSRSNICWTPDSKSIIFSGYQPEEENKSVDRNTDIYQINIDGTDLKKITDNAGRDEYPSLSSDGKMIIFESKRDEGEGIYTMTADGKNQQLVINESYAVQPSFVSLGVNKNVSASSSNNTIPVVSANPTTSPTPETVVSP